MRERSWHGGPVSPDHARFASRLRLLQEQRGWTRARLAEQLGVTATMVGYWRAGRYLPQVGMAQLLSEVMGDPRLLTLVQAARTGRCPCGSTFDREQSRRQYCPIGCQRRAHLKGGAKALDPRQEAIDAMCRGCEPEGICRDDSCALRPYSPLLFSAFRRVA